MLLGPGMFKEILLGHPALIPQSLELVGINAMTFAFEFLLKQSRKGEIHIVAAKQNVLAHGNSLERQVTAFVGDGDQAEVCGSSTDVADQHKIAHLNALTPAVPLAFKP